MPYATASTACSADTSLKCQFILTNDKISYKFSDVIEGNLILTNHKDLHCYGISINLEGNATVKFQEGATTHWDEEELINASCYVFGKRSNVKRMLLKPSRHSFPFSFQILTTCHYPASFKSPYGAVVYQLVAYLHTYSGGVKKTEKIIILHGNNMLDPKSDEPIRFTKSPPLFPSIVKSPNSKLRINVQLGKNGYLPGESIFFLVMLENPERQSVYAMCTKLLQRVNFYAGSAEKTTSRIIVTKENSTYSSQGKIMWKDSINISRGFVSPSSGNIIEHQYFLQVEVFTNDKEAPTVERLPITIGTGRNVDKESSKRDSYFLEYPLSIEKVPMEKRMFHSS